VKVFITGSSGKLGRKITNYLVSKKIYCYCNYNKNYLKKKNSKFLIRYKQNIISKSFLIPLDIDVVCHLGNITKGKSQKSIFTNNLKINKKIFEITKKHKKIKKIIYFSTVAIYGKKNRSAVNEKVKFFNEDLYAKSKYKSEKIFNKLKKIKIYNIRIPGVLLTGKERNFLSNLIFSIKKNAKINLENPQNLFNNVILVNTLSAFVFKLIKNNFKSGTIILGSSKPITIRKITKIIIKLLKSKSKIFWKIKKKGFYLNISKAIEKYDFKPMTTTSVIKKYIKSVYLT